MIVITRTKTEAEGSVKYECPERNDSFGKETKQPNLQKEERSDKSLRVVVVTKRGWVVNQINQTYFLRGLRMKKSVCLMAILGAFAASGAMAAGPAAPAAPNADNQDINITFKGKVIESNCVIVAGDKGVVDLGTFNKTKQTAPIVPVQLAFTGCDQAANKVATVKLKRDGGKFPQQGNVGGHTLSTDQQGINIQLYQDMAGTTPGMAPLDRASGGLNGTGAATAVTVTYAKMVGTKTGQLNNGDAVNGLGVFEVTFN